MKNSTNQNFFAFFYLQDEKSTFIATFAATL